MSKKVLIEGLLKKCETGTFAELQSNFVCSEDSENYYFDFYCEQKFPYPKHKNYNDPLFEGDIVEVLLSLNHKNSYLEIEVNQHGAEYCVIIDNIDGNGDIIITKVEKCLFLSKTVADNEKWKTSITLPKTELEKIGWQQDCYINAHRQDFDSEGILNLYSLYPTFSRSFHKTESFRKLYK